MGLWQQLTPPRPPAGLRAHLAHHPAAPFPRLAASGVAAARRPPRRPRHPLTRPAHAAGAVFGPPALRPAPHAAGARRRPPRRHSGASASRTRRSRADAQTSPSPPSPQVLDIKPYVPYCDSFPQAAAGWVDSLPPEEGGAGAADFQGLRLNRQQEERLRQARTGEEEERERG